MDVTEPNLAFAFTWTDSSLVELRVSLDLEFSLPWRCRSRSGEPFVVTCQLAAESLSEAVAEWMAEITSYPPAGSATQTRSTETASERTGSTETGTRSSERGQPVFTG